VDGGTGTAGAAEGGIPGERLGAACCAFALMANATAHIATIAMGEAGKRITWKMENFERIFTSYFY
jgi:hypothetical protein